MRLRDFTIGTRLGVGFGVILTILVAMVLGTSWLNDQNKAALLRGIEVSTGKNELAGTMKSAILEAGIAMRNMGLQSEVAQMQKEEIKVKQQRVRYDAARDKLQKLGLNGEEQALLSEIAAGDKQVDIAFQQALGQVLAFNSEGAAKVIATLIDPLNQKTLVAINALIALQQAAARATLDGSVASDRHLMLMLFLLGGVGAAVGVGCALLITRSITLPLSAAVAMAQRVAAGELTSSVQVVGKDEISALLQALRDMNASLVKTVGEVRSGTETITLASGEIASGNADLSARTESQASSLEQTASSMEQLTSTVKQNADNARQANQLALSASSVAVKGGSVVNQVVETMGSIKESSGRIVDIIGVIDSIAFQTNILALNAAVEAARAGEQGRGFAVVASEVRNLAQRSAGAAREIKQLIGDSVNQVDAGSRLVDEAGQTMDLIVTSIKQVADIMGEITAATAEQSHGIEEINQAVSQMDEMTQRNAALVEQAAAAAESMQEQAVVLARAVSIFKLSDDQRMAPQADPGARLAPLAPRAAPAKALARPAAKAAERRASKPVAQAGAAPPSTPSSAPSSAPKSASKSVPKPAPAKLAASAGDDWEEF
ncbi:MAG: methyl-accepting chemotaxis protein [Pseudomonadota bacterium]